MLSDFPSRLKSSAVVEASEKRVSRNFKIACATFFIGLTSMIQMRVELSIHGLTDKKYILFKQVVSGTFVNSALVALEQHSVAWEFGTISQSPLSPMKMDTRHNSSRWGTVTLMSGALNLRTQSSLNHGSHTATCFISLHVFFGLVFFICAAFIVV